MISTKRNKHKDFWVILFGFFGIFLLLSGLNNNFNQYYYFTGGLILLIVACYFKLIFFIVLEATLLAEHLSIILGFGLTMQIIIPFFLGFQILFFYLTSNEPKSIFLIIGIIGIAAVAIGYGYDNNLLYFTFGNFCVAIYSYYLLYKGQNAAIIWCVLNTILFCIAPFYIWGY